MKNLFHKLLGVLCAVAILCSLCGTIPVSAINGGGKPNGTIYHWGCDVSFWNVGGYYPDFSLIDFGKMKADGCEFVILRIGYEGSSSRANTLDTAFVQLYNMARAAGMHIGVYFYSLATTYAGAVDDANWVINVIESNNMYFEYPIYYDVEDSAQTSLGSTAMNNLCLGWCETLENAGYYPGIYGGKSQVMDKLSANFLSRYDTWLAYVLSSYTGNQYDPRNPTTATSSFSSNYGMWQYKWYNNDWTPSYEGSYWKDDHGYPLDCNVSYKDYPTIMATYGYNNVVTKHKITFETNGGSAVDPVYVADGKTLSTPTAPTKYAFEFGGWYCDPELTSPYDFSTPVPYGFTLYAKWNEAYWGANTNLMPNPAQLQLNDFNGQGAIWPYWNTDEYGSVTFYNGVTNDENWSWPSAYMTYEHSFDAVGDSYLYVKKDGNSLFNVMLTYLDKDGTAHDLYLSEVANLTNTDFDAGYLEDFYNVGSYIRNLGHAPASGNVKFTKVTYFIIGSKDTYTTLYDCKLTSRFEIDDPYTTLYSKDLTQSGTGSYVYDNGTLTMNATATDGYSVRFSPYTTIKPAQLVNLLMDVNATAPFNVTIELGVENGDATMEFRNEFFNNFNLTSVPTALPAGAWNVDMNLRGYYEWNGGIPAESTIKTVTVTLTAPGSLTLKALQASRNVTPVYVNDGQYASGSNNGENPVPDSITSDVYIMGNNTLSGVETGTTVATLLSGIRESAFVKVFDENGQALAAGTTLGTGDTVAIMNGNTAVRTYTIAVRGDVNGDGEMTTADGRLITLSTLSSVTLSEAQRLAGDYNGNGEANTVDVRVMLRSLLG